MNGLIIHELTKKYFTDLGEIFDVIGCIAKNYNWMLSDYVCNIYPSTKIPKNEHYVWLTGSELINILRNHEIQFIWGVAAAYSENIKLEEVLSHPLPFADGNKAFWKSEITLQNPLSEIEIVPWDSSLLLVIAKSKELIKKLAEKYPNSDDLVEYNRLED